MLAIVLCTAVLLGLTAGVLRPLPPLGLGLVLIATALALPLAGRLSGARLLGLATLACALAALRPTLWPPPTTDALSPFVGSRITAEGRVASAPETRGQAVIFRLTVTNAVEAIPSERDDQPPPLPSPALVEVVASARGLAPRLAVGDWVTAEGRLVAPGSPAGFPRAEILQRQGIFAVLSFPRITVLERATPDATTWAPAARAAVARGFDQHLPQPQAALASGMLLGGGAGLGSTFRQQVQTAGLGHLVAVSGYNIVLVTAALSAVVVRLAGRRVATLPLLLGIAAYTALVGAPPSAVRAAIMASATVLASTFGRIADPLTSVLLAATAMAAWQPAVLLDVGFQLSFAATLGLILLYPSTHARLRRLPRPVAEPLALTLAAQIATLPIVLVVFQQVSLVAPLANLLAAPLVPLIMVAAAALAVSLPLPPVAAVVGWLVWLPTTALVEITRLLSAVPYAALFTGQVPAVAAMSVALGLLVWGLVRLPEAAPLRAAAGQAMARSTISTRLVGGTLGAALLAVTVALVARPDGLFHISLLRAGKGEAIFLRSPRGATVLVASTDADPRGLASLVGDHLNAWERTLSAVVLLGLEGERAAAETLRRYPAARYVVATEDARLDLGGGTLLDVYAGDGRTPAVAAHHGAIWLRLAGEPPPPDAPGAVLVSVTSDGWPYPEAPAFLRVVDGPDDAAGGDRNEADSDVKPVSGGYTVDAPPERSLELLSDGVSVWPRGGFVVEE